MASIQMFRSECRGMPWRLMAGLTACCVVAVGQAVLANPPGTSRANVLSGSSSSAARQEALESIPFEKLDRDAQAKVRHALSNVTIFRRLPIRVTDCDPELHLFLVRHPDVMVSIWEALKLSQLQLRQTGPDTYRAVESDGTTIDFEYLYKGHDTHIVYSEGTYTGSLLQRAVKGSCLVILRSGYVHETDGRYYVTDRMDAFLNVEPGAIEIVTKTLQPIATRIADNNFVQTVAFMGSLSKTAEVNPQGLQRLAAKLQNVQPEVRDAFAALAGKVGEKAAAAVAAPAGVASPPRLTAGQATYIVRQ